MNSTLFNVIGTIERGLRLFGLNVFTVRDDSGLGPFAFERKDHGAAGWECWGLGLHLTVSRLRMSPRV